MIDIEQKTKSDKSFRKKVAEYFQERKTAYFDSPCFTKLRDRYNYLNEHIDMRPPGGKGRQRNRNDFYTKLTFPLAREVFNLRRASLKANFRNPPLVTILPDNDTSDETASNMQDVVTCNLRKTHFRETDFMRVINSVSRWGVACTVSDWRESERKVYKTMRDNLLGYDRKQVMERRANVHNPCISPLNYFQNSAIASPLLSDYRGHIERQFLSKLIADAKSNKELYIIDELNAVIKDAKEHSGYQDENYRASADKEDWDALGVEISYWLGTIKVKGNEDSEINYYAQFVGDKIIRIQENPYDFDLINYNIFAIEPRFEYWWGNTDVESQLQFENFLTIALNMQAHSGLQALKQFIFLDKGAGAIDPDTINRAQQGGIVPVDLKGKHINDVLMPYQGRNISLQDLRDLTAQVKEASDRVKPGVDFQRSPTQGGPQNKTLGGAMMMEQKGNMVDSDYIEEFSFNLARLGEINSIMLQQYLPDEFRVRPEVSKMARVMKHWEILGDFRYICESAMTKSQYFESTRLHNALIAMQNFKGTGDPSWQNLNIAPTIRAWVRSLDLPGDVDETYPDTQGMMQGGLLPAPGMAPNAIPFQAPAAAPQAQPIQMGAA